MRSGSEAALQRVSELWIPVVVAHAGNEVTWARVIFDAADVLSNNSGLLGALEDSSREESARIGLAQKVFKGKVDSPICELICNLVREKWAQAGDLAESMELIGIDTVLIGAQREGLLSKTEEELYHSMRVLKGQRELRLVLNDKYYSRSRRSRLVEEIFTNVNEYSRFLISHAVRRTEHYSIAASLNLYIARCAMRAKHLVASVASVVPLSHEQEMRLSQILKLHYGTEVQLHTTIEPAIIGGLRIHIQDDVIDGTLSTRLAAVKDLLKK